MSAEPEPSEQQDLREEVAGLERQIARLAADLETERPHDRKPHLRESGCGVFLAAATVVALLTWLAISIAGSLRRAPPRPSRSATTRRDCSGRRCASNATRS